MGLWLTSAHSAPPSKSYCCRPEGLAQPEGRRSAHPGNPTRSHLHSLAIAAASAPLPANCWSAPSQAGRSAGFPPLWEEFMGRIACMRACLLPVGSPCTLLSPQVRQGPQAPTPFIQQFSYSNFAGVLGTKLPQISGVHCILAYYRSWSWERVATKTTKWVHYNGKTSTGEILICSQVSYTLQYVTITHIHNSP